ncbi:ABC transporter ATP-binding protein [Edaphobacillus lindanitolerans]|uniref:Peptide/nickel transport system ATP-binding protein/oligopeptide transport system ATP-binding protein n=1 Tax=Edaphobacillus lindanitolerans TaxID=550447 RepID=A0A1U7PIB1_9BACI|nr:ABC transporter ATP-binding protein [Edaphobacillus lindanitolerans]SIT72771.1 peptide/nickel transport system ATP-binding protein/oligopeptide transport system ATP-binding protein [Edaphobacillus lindanitolerans]
MQEAVLKVDGLKVRFKTEDGYVSTVNGVSFTVHEGETLAIVGESGSGKSVTSLALMGILPPNGEVVEGSILYRDRELTNLSKKDYRKIRGNDISMIFQEPMTALNPVFTIGFQLREPLMLHAALNKQQAHSRAIEMLRSVGISDAEKVMGRFPHQLSGGMRQRVMIAMALSCNPKLLIADEPTTALDVTIQAQILTLLRNLKRQSSTSIMIITHDLGVVAEIADRVVVMYAGEIVEVATVDELFESPQHPYTKGLLNSMPKIHDVVDELYSIEGTVPSPLEMPTGCKFHPRCPLGDSECAKIHPSLESKEGDHLARCIKVAKKELVV